MSQKSSQLAIPFDKLTEANLKPILKKFEKMGCPVAKVDAPNQAKRESGMLVKNFTLTFEDGQNLLVRVKAGGTIFQVKLNNKVIPIKHVDDMDKAIGEIYDHVFYNAKAFERAKMQRERKKIKPPVPAITTTRKEKITKIREELTGIVQNNTGIEAQLAEKKAAYAAIAPDLENARNALNREHEKTVSLEKQIADLQKAQGA